MLIEALLACAVSITGLPSTDVLPTVEIRLPTEWESQHSSAPGKATGIYLPYGNGVLIGKRWNILVHEACHHLQRWAGLPFNEPQCYIASSYANKCQQVQLK